MEIKCKNPTKFSKRKIEIMEKSYECYAENGFHGTGIKALAQNCGCAPANFYLYFTGLDDLIVQSTAYCMSKVEDDFMERAPHNAEELIKFIDDVPYWTAREHGKKYRLMYQIYTHPKYIAHGKEFFKGVNERYSTYAKMLEGELGIPYETLTGLIFTLVRASVHYALFEDEMYLKCQMDALKQTVAMFQQKYQAEYTGENGSAQ